MKIFQLEGVTYTRQAEPSDSRADAASMFGGLGAATIVLSRTWPIPSYNARMHTNQPLVRSANSKVAGVCGGLAAWLDVEPTVLRIVWVLGTFFTACLPGILLYLVLWLMMPGPDAGAVSSGTLALSRAPLDDRRRLQAVLPTGLAGTQAA